MSDSLRDTLTSTAPPDARHEQRPSATRNVSPWTTREKVGRLLWAVVWRMLFRPSFHSWYGWRNLLLRRFGAEIGENVRIRRTVRIEIPWHLHIANDVSIGDGAILYALGPITIGSRSFLSQYAHLCAGTHDYRRRDYPLLKPPITIGEDCWIAAEAFVGPGVTVGDGAIAGARAVVTQDVPAWTIVAGNPAAPVRERPRFEDDADSTPR